LSSTDRDPESSGAPVEGTAPARGAATLRAYPEVIEAYLEELGFLGVERRVLLFSHEIGVAELDELDDRMHAHLDGLSHAGDDAMEAIEERLESDDPWEVYAAARAWVEMSRPDLDTLTSRIEAAPEEALPAWTEALRAVAEPVRAYPDNAAARAVLLASAPWAGAVDPDVVAACVGESSAMLRRAAARAGAGAGRGAAHVVASLCEDADPVVRNTALWSTCLLDPESAVQRLRNGIRDDPEPFAVRALGLFGDESDENVLCDLAVDGPPEVRAAAVHALGDLGCARTLDFLAGRLPFGPAVADAAAGAWAKLTGQNVPDLAEETLEGEPEEREDARMPPDWPREPAYESERILRGRRFGEGEDLEALWRRCLVHPEGDLEWLRLEVPAGFFEDAPAEDMRPGE
jgi:hypothetical protein